MRRGDDGFYLFCTKQRGFVVLRRKIVKTTIAGHFLSPDTRVSLSCVSGVVL